MRNPEAQASSPRQMPSARAVRIRAPSRIDGAGAADHLLQRHVDHRAVPPADHAVGLAGGQQVDRAHAERRGEQAVLGRRHGRRAGRGPAPWRAPPRRSSRLSRCASHSPMLASPRAARPPRRDRPPLRPPRPAPRCGRSRRRLAMRSTTCSRCQRTSGISTMSAPPAMPAAMAMWPASRPITSSTMTRSWLAPVGCRRSSASVAMATAVE